MTDTDTYAIDVPVPNLAIGYTVMSLDGKYAAGPRRENVLQHSVKGGPAGGGYSTVDDLLRFSLALQQHRLLTPKSTELLWTAKVNDGPGFGYGYGFGVHSDNGCRSVGHNGGAPGISAEFRCFPDLGFTYVVLSNYDHAAGHVAEFIQQMIVRRAAP
jgi:CubicO group peptidase (beta-lactamase class C family)